MQVNVSRDGQFFMLDISVPKGLVDRELDIVAERIRPKAPVDGFRQGNAPLSAIKTKYADVVKGEASTKLLYTSVEKALKDNNIKNAGNPVLDEEFRPNTKKKFVGLFGLDGGLRFKVRVEAPPEITLGDCRGIEVEAKIPLLDDWFQKEMMSYRAAFGTKQPANRHSELGDQVVVDFHGTISGVDFEGGVEENFPFILGNDDYIPGFDSYLMAKIVGDRFAAKIVFPPTFPLAQVQGKEAVFDCLVKEVNIVDLHPLDDEMAVKMGHESLASLKDAYRNEWTAKFSKPARAQILYEIMSVILQNNPFNVPESWVERERSMQISRMGMDMNQLKDSPQILTALGGMAERSVKAAFILDKIYEQELTLSVTADELLAAAVEEASKYKMQAFEFLERLRKVNQYESFVLQQQQEKVVDYLINNCVIKGDRTSWLTS